MKRSSVLCSYCETPAAELRSKGLQAWVCRKDKTHNALCTGCVQPEVQAPEVQLAPATKQSRPRAGDRPVVFIRAKKWWLREGQVQLELTCSLSGGFDCLRRNQKYCEGWHHEAYSVCVDCQPPPRAALD